MKNQDERFLKLNDVKRMTGLSRTTIYDWIRKGKFPESIKLGERASAWLASEVNSWIKDRIRASREDKGATNE